jgi:hypothetical protein
MIRERGHRHACRPEANETREADRTRRHFAFTAAIQARHSVVSKLGLDDLLRDPAATTTQFAVVTEVPGGVVERTIDCVVRALFFHYILVLVKDGIRE